MKRPLIFSGTTEGRYMSERLSEAGIAHIVSVATEYGELVMEPDPCADIRRGRLTEAEMEALISPEADIVFDATHPYASEVSANIRRACEAVGAEYIRIARAETSIDRGQADIKVFSDPASCAEALKSARGNILLTTGSKELAVYAADESVRERLYVRVLPLAESIGICNEAGISARQIIAMQGPFTMEMNLAVIRQYDISLIVTKSSGRAGGFEEKLAAAHEAGIPVFVTGRPESPEDETGISAAEALERCFGIRKKIHIDLVGTGPGRGSLMTGEARDAIRHADIICGAGRMISSYRDREVYPYFRAADIIDLISKRRPDRLAVLFSGDTGFYSGAAKMRKGLSEWLEGSGSDCEIEVHPGISSFSYLAAKAGIDYSEAALCSMHGRSEDKANLNCIIDSVKHNRYTFVLMSGGSDVTKLGLALRECGLGGCKMVLGSELSYPQEEISMLKPGEDVLPEDKGLYTAAVINENAWSSTLTKTLADDEFIRGRVPMTKECIRHLSILKLGLRENSAVYDIGSGTGSVACEIALQSSSIRVYAIEKKPEACELIRKNAAKLGLCNIEVIHGTAPEAFAGLEAPACAFIGGSSGNLREILISLSTSPDDIRVVINAVSLETMAEIQSVIREFDISDLSIEQVSVSRSRQLGDHHLMTAENPVMIAAFTLGGSR